MNGKEALKELVEYGWFAVREDGSHYAVKPPAAKDLGYYIRLVVQLGTYSVSLDGNQPPMQVTSGPDKGLFFKWRG